MSILTAFVETAMHEARYKMLEDGTFFSAIPNWGHISSFEFWHSRTPPLTFKGVQPENSRLKTRPRGSF